MSTYKQVRARVRNWQKARLISFRLDESVLTEQERVLYEGMIEIKRLLLERWDDNTQRILSELREKGERP